MQTEKISIIVPAYNAEKTLVKCIESILNQNYTNIEILIVNDASQDNTPSIMEGLVKKDPRIILLNHNHNMGTSAARNTGIEHANGEYICFLDSDDTIRPHMISELYKIASSNQADIVMSAINGFEKENFGYPYKFISKKEILSWVMTDKVKSYVGCNMYKKDIVSSVMFNLDYRYLEDVDFIYKVLDKSAIIITTAMNYYNYDTTMSTLSKSKNSAAWLYNGSIISFQKYEYCLEHHLDDLTTKTVLDMAVRYSFKPYFEYKKSDPERAGKIKEWFIKYKKEILELDLRLRRKIFAKMIIGS